MLNKSKLPLWKILVTRYPLLWQCKQTIQRYLYNLAWPIGIQHCHGPKRISYEKNEVIVLCLVRNGELYIKSFIEHYFSLGVKHIVFLDNESTDRTISIAKSYKNTSIFRTQKSFKKYKNIMKYDLIRRFAKKRWCLLVDIDEFFDYPHSDIIKIPQLLEYLNKNGYTTVLAQMLEMFSDKPIAKLKSKPEDSIKDKYPFYDISNIQKYPYNLPHNKISNKDIKLYTGGIRTTVFGLDKPAWRWKHPLIFSDDRTLLVNMHQVIKAHVADFTGVLLHYPFLSDFFERVKEAVRKEDYILDSLEYKAYYKALKQNPNLTIKQKTSKRLKNIKDLIYNKFLVVPNNYKIRTD